MSDRIFVAFTAEDSGRVVSMDPNEVVNPEGTAFDDAVKFSGATQVTVFAPVVRGGREDVVDMNRATGCRVSIRRALVKGRYFCTIKGGSKDNYVHANLIGHGSEVDVDLGNHSDQSREKTTGTFLDLLHDDGSEVSVRVLNADVPVTAHGSGPYRFVFPWPWLGPLHRPTALAILWAIRVWKKVGGK